MRFDFTRARACRRSTPTTASPALSNPTAGSRCSPASLTHLDGLPGERVERAFLPQVREDVTK
ncbi:hypothetical protein [Kamptonema formosum]|uniref:hypothetical protein n=1 Tax=Kamptonema formosum TaxID=331992 RepID=UPI0012DD04E5|nr:hypothetical protein [Oscillatoria sp. PCC 10802]